jgi:dipeptidyl aminopeptidase/acylaminoacyl peptidase
MGIKIRLTYSVLVIACFLLACTPQIKSAPVSAIYVYRFDPPAFVEFSADLQATREIPFSIPPDCGLLDTYTAPFGKFLLIELSCPNGQTVLFLDTVSGSVTQPVRDTDSHFLAWNDDGKSAYLKIDSLNRGRIVQMYTGGQSEDLKLSNSTYDLAVKPNSDSFTFTLSRGLGSGSELNFSRNHGLRVETLYADQLNYISFARYSPDGSQIAFIKIPDSQTPFTVGELWVMNADGTSARKLADADAGHGYAANWSPDGSQIAFVRRENPDDERANQLAEALMSNIYLVNIQSGDIRQITHFTKGRVETPHWSPDGNTLAFNVVLDGRMDVQIAEPPSGPIQPLLTESACCPSWIRNE